MKKRRLILLSLLVLTLTLLLSGCGGENQDLDGMYVATFNINGGKLNLGTSEVTTELNFAYDPGALILDPTVRSGNYLGYKISRVGYDFTGWYTSAECLPDQKWDFSTGVINAEKLTLYAGWEKQIVYSFTVCYTDGAETVTLGSYNVKAGAIFEDYRHYANGRAEYTPVGYYADAGLTTPWNFEAAHPGGETDCDIKVYVDYIPGEWLIVDTYSKLKSAIGEGNIYLTANIDCEGGVLSFGNLSHIFEGNGYTVSNFTVERSTSTLMPTVSVFKSLKEGSEVRNVSFADVTFLYTGITGTARYFKVAALATDGTDCKVTNVTVSGTVVTNYEGDLPRLNEAIYENFDTVEISGFSANITVTKQS